LHLFSQAPCATELEGAANQMKDSASAIRWGPDASSDLLRRSARCTDCDAKGAILQHPIWTGSHVGFEPFPRGCS
jgi:hypothetical protein